jgi:HEAT repeat protein
MSFLLSAALALGAPLPTEPPFPAETDTTEKLLRDLRRDDQFVRAAAIDLLGKRKERAAIPRLIELLTDGRALPGSDNWVGGHAANALSEITGRPFSTDPAEWRAWWAGQQGRSRRK